MLLRTYFRTILNDIFKNNIVVRAFHRIVNFYFNLWFNRNKTIKFGQKLSIKKEEGKRVFSFQSVTGDMIDCK